MYRIVLVFIIILISCTSYCHDMQDDTKDYERRAEQNSIIVANDPQLSCNCPAFNKKINSEEAFHNYAKSRNTVYFNFDRDQIKDEGVKRIDKMISELSKVSDIKVILRGYADRVGAEKYNQNLSIRRAKSVKKALINSGIIKESNIIIETIGFGEYDPLISSSAIENNASSRRVDMYIIKNNEPTTNTKNHEPKRRVHSCRK